MTQILRIRISAAVLVVVAAFICVACGGTSVGDPPKQVVIKLFGAMERNDRGAIANSLDLAALMQGVDADYALQVEPPRRFALPTEILTDLTDSGRTKQVWFSMQRVIGDEEKNGDTAFVEVSFVNKETGVQYFNKFGLRRQNGHWRIFAFRTM